MRRLARIAALGLLGIALGGYLLRGPLLRLAMGRVVESNLTSTLVADLPDGLHAVLCGAGSPLPDPGRSGPCTAVIAGRRLFVVDAGGGSSRILFDPRVRVPQGEIEAVLLTHLHSDHIDGLGEMLVQRWAGGGHTAPLPVHGPEGVEEVVAGFNRAYRLSQGYRVAHHGDDVVPASGAGAVARPFVAPGNGRAHVVVDEADLRVIAFRVVHDPVDPAVGYRFDYKGRSIVISGDTIKSANLQSFAQGTDVLIHEALAPHLVELFTDAARSVGRDRIATITTDILDYHTTPVEAAEIARDAGVGHLVYTHIVPPLPVAPLEELFLEGVDDVYEGPVTVGRDGTLVRLDAGGDSIAVEALL